MYAGSVIGPYRPLPVGQSQLPLGAAGSRRPRRRGNPVLAPILSLGLLLSSSLPSIALDTVPEGAVQGEAPEGAKELRRGDAAYHFAMAELYAADGSTEEARESFRRAVELDPEAPYLRLSYADFLYGSGAVPEASEQLEAALKLIPDDLEALRLVARVELARVYEEPSSLDRAIDALERIGRLDPDDLDSRLALGRLYVESDRVEQAIDVFERLLEVIPSNRRVRTLWVDSLMRMPAESGAEEKLAALLKDLPDFLPARLALAQLYADRGEFRDIAGLLRGAPLEQQDHEELMSRLAGALYHTAELEEANRVLDELLRIEPEHPSGNFFRVLVYQAEGRHAEAETILRSLLSDSPSEMQLIQLLIASLEAQEDWAGLTEFLGGEADRAVAAGEVDRARAFRMSNIVAQARGARWDVVLALVDEMAKELPGDVDLGLLRAEALQRLERTDEAITTLSGIAAEADTQRDIDVRKMQYLLEADRLEEAAGIVERLVETGEVDDLRAVAEAYQRAELYEQSVDYLERLVSHDDSIEVLFWLAAAYERIGRYDASVESFRKLLAEQPDFAPGLNYLGYMWAERGENLEEALTLIARAVEIDPANGAYIDSLGWVLYQLGRYDEAMSHLERAARLAPDDGVVLEHLGDAERRAGKLERARKHYRRALEADEENAPAVRQKLRELERP